LCSKTFYAIGNCTGKDELAILRDDKGWPAAQLVKPWEITPIRIVGVEIMVTHGPSLDYAFAGNSATPDVMLMVGAGARWGRVFYPAGLGFALPGAASHSHVDLHISCGAGEPQATARAKEKGMVETTVRRRRAPSATPTPYAGDRDGTPTRVDARTKTCA